MDVAYDHIQEETLPATEPKEYDSQEAKTNLNSEFQEAFKAVSSSPWGAALGGWLGQAKKQGETLYQDLSTQASGASEQATKGLTSLREQVANQTRGLSLNAESTTESKAAGDEGIPDITTTPADDKRDTRSVDLVRDAGSLVASLRSTAAAKLKDLQAAEDAADEALLKFGTNVRNFLRDAVTISAPGDADESKPRGKDAVGNEVLFETQEPGTGKKVFHTTRLDAQLHAIHTAAASFAEDPQGEEWEEWKTEFDVEKQTDAIAADLERYEELRRAMEKLVPEKVEYKIFWVRYYFLRKAIEEEERRRREVLKGAAADNHEEVGWGDDDEEESTTPNVAPGQANTGSGHKFSESTTTLNAPAANDLLKPKSPRRSEDKMSVAGSDASYDMVSGAASGGMGSPREEKKDETDEEDDWE